MRINKTDNSYVTSQIITYIDSITSKNYNQNARKSFDYVLELFTYKVEFDTISIECTKEDVDFLLYDYIKTLTQKHHLAIYVFVDRQVNVETVNKLKRFKELSEFFDVTPNDLYDDKIQIHIGFFTGVFGEQYDTNLIADMLPD